MDFNSDLITIRENNQINWKKYIFLAISNWYWFLITMFIGISTAYMINRYKSSTFQVETTLLLEDDGQYQEVLSQIKSFKRIKRKTDLANEIAKLKAYSLHRKTITELGWDILWTGHGRIAKTKPLYKLPPYHIDVDSSSSKWYEDKRFLIDQINEQKFKLSDKIDLDTVLTFNEWHNISDWKVKFSISEHRKVYSSYSFIFYNPNTLTHLFRSKVQYQYDDEEGTIILLHSQGPIVSQEMDYLNALTDNYIRSELERKNEMSENTLQFVEDQVAIIKDSLEVVENQLLAFRIQNEVIDLSTEGQAAYNNLNQFYEQKTQLSFNLNYFIYLLDYIKTKEEPESIIVPSLMGINDPLLVSQINNLQKTYDLKEELEFTAKENNPSLIHAREQIQSIRLRIIEVLESLIHNTRETLRQIEIEENNIMKVLLDLPIHEQAYLNIQRKYEVNNQFYTFLLEKRAEAGIQKASTISNINILDRAYEHNAQYIGIKKTSIFLIAILFGLLIPFGILIIIEILDTRIKDKDDILFNTDIPIVGVITHEESIEKVPVHIRPGSAFAESFRHIRTNLQSILTTPEDKIIMITSTVSGEGKTFIASNLAAILAMNNKKVVICGFDLRRPSLHKIFDLPNDSGISTFLSGKNNLNKAIISTGIPNLDLLPAGPIPPNPAELLESDSMEVLVDNLKGKYDYIIFDTPPVALVTDALILSKYVRANIFVIRQQYTDKAVLELINKISKEKLKRTYILVNDIRESKAFGYRYYYGYGYGYGYSYNYNYRYGGKYYTDLKE